VLLSKRATQAFARMGWGVLDQGISSLTNFAVAFFLAHTLTPAGLGAYSLTYLTYGFALNASRGMSTDPLLVRYSGVDVQRWRRATGWATGTAIVMGLIAGCAALTVATIVGGTAGSGFLALGLTLPGLMLQDSWRYCFFAMGRGGHAFLNDTIWATVLVLGILALRMTGHVTLFWAVFAWGAAANVAAAIGPLQARVMPKVSHAWTWAHMHRDLGPRYLVEGTVNNSAFQIRAYGTSAILGLAALGWLQASVTLFGPMTILFLAMGLVIIPEAARVLRSSPERLGWFCFAISSIMSAIAFLWGITLLVGLPRGLGNLLLGPIWRPTYPLVLPSLMAAVGATAAMGTGAVMHALGASRKTLRLAVFGMAIFVGFSLAGAALMGAPGVVWGTAISIWIGAIVSWWQMHVALREANLPQSGIRELITKFFPRRAVIASAPIGRHSAPARPDAQWQPRTARRPPPRHSRRR
jgi:O-antigen/teichoic acid export membrane protein